MSTTTAGRAAVIGGSLAGLSAAVSLGHAGYDVTVYEQSPHALDSHGAGIVLQPEVELLLETFGVVDPMRIATSCTQRQYLRRDGTTDVAMAMPQRFTAWNALYRHLRAAVGDERIRQGQHVCALTDGPDTATLHLADGSQHSAELAVAADGWNSSVRHALLPDVEPSYAGYVAWRGVANEKGLPASVLDVLVDRFTFYEVPEGGHVLCYLVPGVDGQLDAGARRLNWVWYVSVTPGADLDAQLTDAHGVRRALSVAPGSASAGFAAAVRDHAREMLPDVLAELITRTREPFVQAVVDLASPRMAWQRVCLVGDAAFVPRPHTAASTAKAAGDVLALAISLREHGIGHEPAALRGWEPDRLAVGRTLGAHGRRLGSWSQAAHSPARR